MSSRATGTSRSIAQVTGVSFNNQINGIDVVQKANARAREAS
jgi:hypothetical protein